MIFLILLIFSSSAAAEEVSTHWLCGISGYFKKMTIYRLVY